MGLVRLDVLTRATAEEAGELLAAATTADLVALVHGVSERELAPLIARDELRTAVLVEICTRLPGFLNPRRARGVRAVLGFRVTGGPDDRTDRVVLRVADGAATVLTGEAADAVPPEERSATVTCSPYEFLRLVTGQLSPITGVLRGQLKVRGDKAAALRVAGAFDIPTAVSG